MEPAEWREWTDTEREGYARVLLASKRGHFVISQALTLAMERLVELEALTGEPLTGEPLSIFEDMKLLVEGIFYAPVASSILKGDQLRRALEAAGSSFSR